MPANILITTVVILLTFVAGNGVRAQDADVEALHSKAEQGDARAQAALGDIYKERGDPVEAEQWYLLAAERSNADAQDKLGVMYYNGSVGVRQDYAKAEKWSRKAAEQGNADAQRNLGVMYENGHGVKKDNVQSYLWYSLSAAQKYEFAADYRDRVAKRMTPEQIAEAQKLAREWRPKKP